MIETIDDVRLMIRLYIDDFRWMIADFPLQSKIAYHRFSMNTGAVL